MKQESITLNARVFIALAAVSVIVSVLALMPAHAASPEEITYQGRLIVDGEPVNVTKSITFRICADASVACGSAPGQLFSENYSALSVTNGLFSARIGSLTGGGIPASVFRSTGTYLEILVDSVALTPREKITANMYSMRALQADTLVTPDGAKQDRAAGWLFLASHTLTASAASYTFPNLPAMNFLEVRAFVDPDVTASRTFLQFNGDTGANYTNNAICGASTEFCLTGGTSNNHFSTAEIANVSGFNKLGQVSFRDAAAAPTALVGAAIWANAAVINQILIGRSSGNMNSGSTFMIFGRN